jgi:EF-hand domain pair
MTRFLLAVGLLVSIGAISIVAADDEKKEERKRSGFGGFGKFDAAAMFKRMDANGDGKVTREEFEKGFAGFGAFGGGGGKGGFGGRNKGGNGNGGNFAGRLFDRLDTDKDGNLTQEEFTKGMSNGPFGGGGFGGGFGRGKGGNGGFGRPKDNTEKPAKPEELPPPREKP